MATDAVGIVSASAAIAQALLGESAGGVASRLQAALGRELGRARGGHRVRYGRPRSPPRSPHRSPPPGSVAPGRVDGVQLVARLGPSLDARALDRADDARTRIDRRSGGERFEDEAGGHPGDECPEDERAGDGRAGDGGRTTEVEGRVTLDEREVGAIESALATVQAAADALDDGGTLHAVVLSGRVLSAVPRSLPECRLLVLCLAFDGELGASRRVWGHGYAEDRLRLTLDARWTLEDEGAAADGDASGTGRWRFARPGAARTRPPVLCTLGGQRHEGLSTTASAGGSVVPPAWAFVDVEVAPA